MYYYLHVPHTCIRITTEYKIRSIPCDYKESVIYSVLKGETTHTLWILKMSKNPFRPVIVNTI